MPFEGGKVVQLTNGKTANDLHPTWSPDRHSRSHSVGSANNQDAGKSGSRMSSPTPALSSSGSDSSQNGAQSQAPGSPGQTKSSSNAQENEAIAPFSIWTLDYNPTPGTASRETELATAPNQALINPAWSPDGSFITFAAVPNSESWSKAPPLAQIHQPSGWSRPQGTGKIKLTDGDSIDLMPVWGRNNDIFFVSNMDGQDHLWSMELSPCHPRRKRDDAEHETIPSPPSQRPQATKQTTCPSPNRDGQVFSDRFRLSE